MLGRPIVTVVKTAQAIMGKDATRGYVASSAPRRFLSQSKMRAVFVMVGDILGKQPHQVPAVEGNHMVEQLTSAAPDQTLGNGRNWRDSASFSDGEAMPGTLVQSLGYCVGQILGFRAVHLLGYVVVPVLGYCVEQLLGFQARIPRNYPPSSSCVVPEA